MNIRNNPDSGEAEIQVDDDVWRPIEEVAAEATKENRSLRTHLREKYGRIIEKSVPASAGD